MKLTLLSLVLALFAAAQTPSESKFITADQVKAMWIKDLPQPRTLDANYHKIVKSYKLFIADIEAGKRDLAAQETAATHNKAKAIEMGNTELASTYEAELARIAQEKSTAHALAQQQRLARQQEGEAVRLNAQLLLIDSKIRNIKNSLREP